MLGELAEETPSALSTRLTLLNLAEVTFEFAPKRSINGCSNGVRRTVIKLSVQKWADKDRVAYDCKATNSQA
jgi:hypothetical protein